MTFSPKKTNDGTILGARKTLLVAEHGFGKTTQAKNFLRRYGKGFIICGEGGLLSISDMPIDYLHFSSWDGAHDPSSDVYSFKGIIRMINTPEFRAENYKWIMVDSVTEVSDLCLSHFERAAEVKRIADGKKNADGWATWGDYNSAIIGACKYIRDLPMHVIVTALTKEDRDDNGAVKFWPMVAGQKAQRQIPGIFDNVLFGLRETTYAEEDTMKKHPTIVRSIITDEVDGYHGKIRTPYPDRFNALEPTGDVTDILAVMEMTEPEWKIFQDLNAPAEA